MKRKEARRPELCPGQLSVLLVNNHLFALELLKMYLGTQRAFRRIEGAHDAGTALRKARQFHPQIVIINLDCSRLDGPQMTHQLLKSCPRAGVIGFSARQGEEWLWPMLNAGARGCVAQESCARELLPAIQAVHRGEVFISPAIVDQLASQYQRRPPLRPNPLFQNLSETEVRIVQLIAEGRCNKEMAVTLKMSVRTIEKYREAIKLKLRLKSVAELTKFAIRQGISSLD